MAPDTKETPLYPIGIDLGTTNTVCSVYRDGVSEIIPNLDGSRLTPSVVFYSPDDLSATTGKLAEDEALKWPGNFLYDMKRIIGRGNDDVYVTEFISNQKEKRRGLKFKRGLTGFPCIELHQNKQTDLPATTTAVEVSSEILKYMKISAEAFLGSKVTEAVISVPAYFSYAQRQATKQAAKNIGLNVLRLITEPVAAAIHYTYGKYKNDTQLLIVDLGGGTLDVSVIKCTENKFEVRCQEGDMFLGGRDFNDIIFNFLIENIKDRFGESWIDAKTAKGERFLHRLWKLAVKYKHALSTKHSYSISFSLPNGDECDDIILTRAEFEKLSQQLFDRIIYKVHKCLKSKNISVKEIDKVVLAGGSTRIPKLKLRLTSIFGKEPCTDLNPDEAVALGASIHAALLKKEIPLEYKIEDMAPHSLGILAKYNLMTFFIHKGSPLPVYEKEVMETSENDQQSVIFNIYEGERKNCKYNKKIGEFIISNLPPGRAGQVQFEVMFVLDENGLLQVRALEMQTNKSNHIEIKMNELSVCDTSMFLSLEDESLKEKEDFLYENFYKLKLSIDTYCNSILYDIENKKYRHKKDEYIKQINNLRRQIETISYKNIDSLQSKFDAFLSQTRLYNSSD